MTRRYPPGSALLPLVACLGFAATPEPAWAHAAVQTMGGFWAGVYHLLTSLDQLCLLSALSIWASLQKSRLDAQLVGAVMAGSLVGAAATSLLGWRPDTLVAAAGLMLLTGLAGALWLRPGGLAVLGVAAAAGTVVGLQSADVAAGLSFALFLCGTTIAAASVLSYGLILAGASAPHWVRIGFRAVASWVAAIGLMVLALQLSRSLGHR